MIIQSEEDDKEKREKMQSWFAEREGKEKKIEEQFQR
jgi:hypothetical protein